MDISVTLFKAQCLDLIRKVEAGGKPVVIRRRGKAVARLEPAANPAAGGKPWENLRALGGRAAAAADESVLADEDFEALR
jgi:prevent-host-death family protein